MSYSLLSRFRGLLLGALIGELWVHLDGGGQGNDQPRRALGLPLADAIATQIQGLLAGQPPSGAAPELWLARILPLALVYHDDPHRYRRELEQIQPADPLLFDGAMVIGQGIAAAMAPCLMPLVVIPSLPQRPPFGDEIQQHLQRRRGIAAMTQTLQGQTIPSDETAAIALAYYAWLSTPHQFSLALRRTARAPQGTSLALLLTGALVGATVGIQGIPTAWLAAMERVLRPSHPLQDWLALAEPLLVYWAGGNPTATEALNLSQVAIAAPGRLRSR